MSEFTLQAIIDGDSLQLSEVFASIAAAESVDPAGLRLQLGAELLRGFIHTNSWDTRLQPLLDEFTSAACAQIAKDDEFYCSAQHPLRVFFSTITPPASHWCKRDSKPNQQLFDKLSALLAFATTYWSASEEQQIAGAANLQQQLDDFTNWLAAEDKRAAMLEARLCETELANLKLISAEARVAEAINHNLAERPLPIELHNAIAITLKSELQYWAFNTDPAELSQLPLWKSWQRLLPALGQLFSGDGIEVDDQLLYDQIPLVLAELERSLQYPNSNAQAYVQLVEQLNHCLMSAIQKQAQECSLFSELANPGGQSDMHTHIPKTLLQQTDSINVGDWIIFNGDGADSIRCKLALKNPAIDQLLFVDHTGRKVMNKNTKDFALCLSTGIARPLLAQDLAAIIYSLLPSLIERANRSVQAQLLLQKNKAEQVVRALIAQQQAAAAAAEVERAAEQARIEEQLEARRAAARKAMMEARALADEKMRREAEQAAEAERLRIEQAATQAAATIAKHQQASQSISELQVGAWLEINSEQNADEKLRAKLSVIISSTGKYIFADQVGRKLAEYTREQLITLMVEEQIKILRNGDNFEDQLAKVIRGLRRDVS
ncbi:DUF1631 family protein [Cellvibrio fibrivorans]|uniref:DUF1631 domain-containing protein n=1 Tax=Cellvibrio fibrivorans TaxID=126350 RepID=A0ABU1UZ48_9GAMM|nr:DUF1631 family protein [Cellvibrio fibrivorans]MDR7090413.1 hypothetical protein [Cellvibrio fibrivorans]